MGESVEEEVGMAGPPATLGLVPLPATPAAAALFLKSPYFKHLGNIDTIKSVSYTHLTLPTKA